MRPAARRGILALTGAAAVIAATVTPALTQESPRPNLAISGTAEPPDTAVAGGELRLYFTAVNTGRRSAGPSAARAYLSISGTRRDVALNEDRAVPELPRGGQATRTITPAIPASVRPGTYFLLVCADVTRRVRESSETDNCWTSGQRLSVGAVPQTGPAGPSGAAGPQGPKGDRGADAPAGQFRRLPRTVLGSEEGTAVTAEPLRIGPVTFRLVCDESDDFRDQARIEAKTDAGTLSAEGHDAFPGDSNDSFPQNNAEIRTPEAAAGTYVPLFVADRDNNEGFGPDGGTLYAGFRGGRALVTTSGGTEIVLDAYAGMDTLGAGSSGDDGDDDCVFGGSATVVQE
jgi:hypothetical protein